MGKRFTTTIDFFVALGMTGERGKTWFVTLNDKDPARSEDRWFNAWHKVHRTLYEKNEQGHGVFWTVNRATNEGRTTAHIQEVRAIFVDLDGAPLPEALLDSTPATAIVETSPGRHHIYWRVQGVPLDWFKRLQSYLAMLTSGDDKIVDLPRIMRVPGYLHQKRKPFMVRATHLDPDAIYAFDEFVPRIGCPPPGAEPAFDKMIGYRPPESERRRKVERYVTKWGGYDQKPDGMSDRGWRSYVERQREAERKRIEKGVNTLLDRVAKAPAGERNNTLYTVACALANDIADGKLDEANVFEALYQVATSNGLSPTEVEQTIHSAFRYA